MGDLERQALLGRAVTVEVDRPFGSTHPDHPDIIYPVNYGYIDGLPASDGEWQDAYVLGMTKPVKRFFGVVIAVIVRENDTEDKLVVAPPGCIFDQARILELTHFQEQFFKIRMVSVYHKSTGMIVFRRDDDAIRYLLLLQRRSRSWSFPKGHAEPFETERQTAIREVREETGQTLRPIRGFRAVLKYTIAPVYSKTVILFLAEAQGKVTICADEIIRAQWATAEEARKLLKAPRYANILSRAEGRIKKIQ